MDRIGLFGLDALDPKGWTYVPGARPGWQGLEVPVSLKILPELVENTHAPGYLKIHPRVVENTPQGG